MWIIDIIKSLFTHKKEIDMDLVKLIADVEKLVVDAQPVVADVEAIIADLQTPNAEGKFEANGDVIKALLALLENFASNPAVLAIVQALLAMLLKKPA
jgi:t-SNARE complex subunit (syntaxin)